MEEVIKYGKNADGGLLINASRAIIYAGSEADFDEKAKELAMGYHEEMKLFI
jgi:orotidine-5'-phosphate decarboxylase